MILPPFFGLHSKYDEGSIKQSIISYITADIIAYKDPTPSIILSYSNLDALCYTTKPSLASISYKNIDILSVAQTKSKANISYLQCDILMYSLPLSVPDSIPAVSARDKDGSAILTWQAPFFDGKSPITRYDIQYKQTSEVDWVPFVSNSNNTFARVSGLLNNNEYHFRIAPVNLVGTGNYTISNSTEPEAGEDNVCNIIAYIGFNFASLVDMRYISCFSTGNIRYTPDIGVVQNFTTIDSSYAVYIPDNPITINTAPHNGQISYNHINISGPTLDSWSLLDDFTISFWCKPEDSGETIRTIVSATSEESPQNSWKISYTNDTIIFSSGVVGDMKTILSSNNLNISTTEYTHISLCRSKGYISLFINGLEKNEIFDNNNISINSEYLIIGAYGANYNYSSFNSWGIVTEPFNGYIDELLISRSCLYRKNFDTNLPNTIRSFSFCEDCENS